MLDEKAPSSYAAHLSQHEGYAKSYDLAQLPAGASVIGLYTPTKKSGEKYTNHSSIAGSEAIEAVCLSDIDALTFELLSSLPNLKYLKITNSRQEVFPCLAPLKSLEVLILASLTRVKDFSFFCSLSSLKTLYIDNLPHLVDLEPITALQNLEELSLHHGMMSGTGTPAKSLEPLAKMKNLHYLRFSLNVEKKNYDITPLLGLKKLKRLYMLPRFLKDGRGKQLLESLPLLEKL